MTDNSIIKYYSFCPVQHRTHENFLSVTFLNEALNYTVNNKNIDLTACLAFFDLKFETLREKKSPISTTKKRSSGTKQKI